MSAYTIFCLVYTFATVATIAIMVTIDTYGKKDEQESEEETYDVSDLANEEQPVAIEECDDNSDEGDLKFTEQVTEDGLRVVNPTGNTPLFPPSFPEEQPEASPSTPSTTSEELNDKNDERLEHIEPDNQYSYASEEFMQFLNNKHNTRKIEKKNARDKL